MKRRRDDRGVTAVEYIGFLPILILVGICLVQFGLAAYTMQQAGTAARTAARIGSQGSDAEGRAAGEAAVSDLVRGGTRVDMGGSFDDAEATATVRIPSIIPGFDFDPVKRTSTMPRD
ncbi:septum formation initiator [Streptomyces lunaelactis]|uniref:Septum formation initiator n=1 Tax=Streptomyces lunaelactis TaxID=1535768 RepID=A0A2R4T7C1_9ACTN|nr:TadE/TadG family type IV pilus assembly protein [Streptomyces lunaelactis]AVZ75039.1 septum formation initiator [Streptomyces lunaelactis]NUK04730.1 pilus assembly protein [Streptomyces lunaelactis]NUK11316.1 pilus assembly protein [Streptomyces lunaelactis]NUK17720.1 pilus assembly protein [Streptomyces lunaelactis]NUK26351.1 pilus assembly protein [Streptomyces lunaelactis]